MAYELGDGTCEGATTPSTEEMKTEERLSFRHQT